MSSKGPPRQICKMFQQQQETEAAQASGSASSRVPEVAPVCDGEPDQPHSSTADEKVQQSTQEEKVDEDDDEEEEEVRAPLELMMEFLSAVKDKDYELAIKLCQMTLLFEPDNPEAKEFLPLLKQKLLSEKESSEEEDDDSDSEDNSSHTSSSSVSPSSSSASSPDEDEEEDEGDEEEK